MEIEYFDEFQELQETHSFKGQQWFGKRSELVDKYSWAIPTEDVIRYCTEFDGLIEIGAGNGYWANLIQDCGGDVTPIDISPPDNTYTFVQERDWTTMMEEMTERPVLMVWPPYNEGVAAGVAKCSPSHILYVGETRGGCTAEDEFFDILDEKYGLIGKMSIPSYAGVRDNFFHYTRNI